MLRSLLFFSLSLASAKLKLPEPVEAKNITGYIVTAQWAESMKQTYSLAVSRQNTAFSMKPVLPFQTLEAATTNPVGIGTVYTAFDPVSRLYFTTAANGTTRLSNWLWATNISKDVETGTPVCPPVTFDYFEVDAKVLGLRAVNVNGVVQVLVIYATGEVFSVDYKTGKTTSAGRLADGTNYIVTPAIAHDPKTKRIYAITQASEGQPNRNVSTLDLTTGVLSSVSLQALKFEKPFEEDPFSMVWVDSLQVLLQFQTGPFDQLKYVNPTSGEQSWAFFDLSQFDGTQGHFEILANQHGGVNDDTWQQMFVAPEQKLVYFQCSDVDPEGGDYDTALCMGPIYDKIREFDYVNPAVEPFQYGYAGFQYVPVLD